MLHCLRAGFACRRSGRHGQSSGIARRIAPNCAELRLHTPPWSGVAPTHVRAVVRVVAPLQRDGGAARAHALRPARAHDRVVRRAVRRRRVARERRPRRREVELVDAQREASAEAAAAALGAVLGGGGAAGDEDELVEALERERAERHVRRLPRAAVAAAQRHEPAVALPRAGEARAHARVRVGRARALGGLAGAAGRRRRRREREAEAQQRRRRPARDDDRVVRREHELLRLRAERRADRPAARHAAVARVRRRRRAVGRRAEVDDQAVRRRVAPAVVQAVVEEHELREGLRADGVVRLPGVLRFSAAGLQAAAAEAEGRGQRQHGA